MEIKSHINSNIQKLARFARSILGEKSRYYVVGSAVYTSARHTLKILGMQFNEHACDNMEIARLIANQSRSYEKKETGKNVVFFTIRGWPVHLVFESLLAAKLQAEGHNVNFITCSDSLPFCMYGSINSSVLKRRDCANCVKVKDILLKGNFDVCYLEKSENMVSPIESDVLKLNLEECRTYVYDNAPYGELVYQSLVWYLRRSLLTISDTEIYRSAILSAHAVRRSLEKYLNANPVDVVVFLNGDFSAEKCAGWVLEKYNVRYISYDHTFEELFSFGVNNSVWDDLTYTNSNASGDYTASKRERRAAEMLLDKWRTNGGYQGNIVWGSDSARVIDIPIRKTGLTKKPLAVAYTNMTFESSVIGKNRIFQDQFSWLIWLVDFFTLHDSLHLVVRVHPAEARDSLWKPNESLYVFLMQRYPVLPQNICIIGPEEKVSSYKLGMLSDAILVYSSTIGIEMAERGKRVITVADVHYGGCGFTVDPKTENEYGAEITTALNKLQSVPRVERKRLVNYIAWLFERRLTRFEALSHIGRDVPTVNVESIDELLDSRFSGIQRITRLIIDGEKWW